jgi:hypothetical protein
LLRRGWILAKESWDVGAVWGWSVETPIAPDSSATKALADSRR